jgi:hypothetical protein
MAFARLRLKFPYALGYIAERKNKAQGEFMAVEEAAQSTQAAAQEQHPDATISEEPMKSLSTTAASTSALYSSRASSAARHRNPDRAWQYLLISLLLVCMVAGGFLLFR